MAVETIRAAIRHRDAIIASIADIHLLYMYIDDRANLLLAMYNALLRTYSDITDIEEAYKKLAMQYITFINR